MLRSLKFIFRILRRHRKTLKMKVKGLNKLKMGRI